MFLKIQVQEFIFVVNKVEALCFVLYLFVATQCK